MSKLITVLIKVCEGPRICAKMYSMKGIPGLLMLLMSGFKKYGGEIFIGG